MSVFRTDVRIFSLYYERIFATMYIFELFL